MLNFFSGCLTTCVTGPANIEVEPEATGISGLNQASHLGKEPKMLVLSRKKNQSIVIDNCVEVEVLQIKGNTIRLGIKAPQSVKILRGELQPVPIREFTVSMDDANSSAVRAG